jgi:1-deoxy-D-xylulose-5-phosphate synthase
VAELARTHDAMVTVEEGCVMGGAGSAVLESLQAAGLNLPVLQLGLPDEFIEHGDPAKLLALWARRGRHRAVDPEALRLAPALLRPAVNS